MHDEKHGASGDTRSSTGPAPRGTTGYPLGRGYGHDLMRGGEVFGGYGYSERPEYAQRRGEQSDSSP
jgi:hypothetical protein